MHTASTPTPDTTPPTAGIAPREAAAPPAHAPGYGVAEPAAPALRVVALLVTWNRKGDADRVLRALAAQGFGAARLDVVVIDNASTDGTSDHLIRAWRPTRVYDNATERAHEPAFRPVECPEPGNPFASLTIVRNARNHGGCGGFNTGFAFAEKFVDSAGAPLTYAWLLDDDIDLPPDALERLVGAAEADPGLGLIGSRTVDIADRTTTVETTIYLDPDRGLMGPDPPAGHRLAAAHAQWAAQVGGTRGGAGPYTGVRDVDVVPACSTLARWSAAKRVGFWDARFFIYCDDADWCLRFAKAGYRVAVNLDAVVFHSFWLTRLTPARGYYASRNLLWLLQKNLPREQLRSVTLRKVGSLLLESRKAMTHCRLFHAQILRRTVEDAISSRGGPIDPALVPPATPLLETFDAAGALAPGGHVAVMCSHPESIAWAEELRARLAHALGDRGELHRLPRFTYVTREGVEQPPREPVGEPEPRRRRFHARTLSKLRLQLWLLRDAPRAVVVFDQHNDAPLVWSRRNIHLDRRTPAVAQLERDGWGPRLAFLARWAVTAARGTLYAAQVQPRPHAGKFG